LLRLKNTQLYITRRRQSGEKAVWKAERAWFLDLRERRAKPETEPLLPRWGKSGVLSNHSARAVQTVFSSAGLRRNYFQSLGKISVLRTLNPHPVMGVKIFTLSIKL